MSSINQIIVYIMVIFMTLGAIDKCLDNKFGLGEKFDEGFMAMGSLAIAMVGVVSLAPVLAKVLKPVVVPLYTALGADPSMFATTLLACDMGGYPLAIELAQSQDAGLFAGLILGSMMGPTIVFTIPVALGIIKEEDRKFLASGVLAGIITIPIGCLVGGLVAGFSLTMILKNLVPIIIFAVLIALGLWKIPEKMIKGFNVFGKIVVIIITIGLAAIIIETLTGIVVIPGMAPITEGIQIIGSIAIMLAGAFPMVYFITKVFKKPLMKLGGILGMGDVAAAGMVATLANNIPMFGMMKDMDDRGKVINVAFAVSAAFVFGDHLGFTAGVNKDMIFPMIVGKLVGGITAVILACIIAPTSTIKKSSNSDLNSNSQGI
ncbi:ethanolamine transporter [Clostridium tetanomorphum]|uniref:Ethanolamine utilization protein EutH n=2 Tax=Clostridium TaxID=1485 RepID=A0A923J120_CLOTT|nr:ethanolamine utilization protein EutH [Clostridium tetanomorphum]KAJ52583.1 ethanolamine utilization protein EutH [Clostridium tetanomorphum DSM 665]MBC2396863.1 ethanolamine utilization protein EutH [Clostridium tetanomorphum]MBP1863175.1 ethanolamine transporter [Clostridium tetanomorphum]NRS84283.1 ethanolamine transporter [Clostridium tetanomorphum]NRZ97497.1 ethanolamine transporter [Clostridium tetanomorphum]